MMPVCTTLEKRNGVVVGAELSCSVREENKTQRESYSADWQSVSLKTQPQDRWELTDQSKKYCAGYFYVVRVTTEWEGGKSFCCDLKLKGS